MIHPIAIQAIAAHFLARMLCLRRGAPRATSSTLVGTAVFAAAAFMLMVPGSDRGVVAVLGLVLSMAVVRLVLDAAAALWIRRSWAGFLGCELITAAALIAVTSAFASPPIIAGGMADLLRSPRLYAVVAAFAGSTYIGAILVPLVTRLLDAGADPAQGIRGAGMLIGVLERLLITALVIFWPSVDASAIGLIFSAKSIARFPELKDQAFAEYYLVGSLTSFAVAISAGLAARALL